MSRRLAWIETFGELDWYEVTFEDDPRIVIVPAMSDFAALVVACKLLGRPGLKGRVVELRVA